MAEFWAEEKKQICLDDEREYKNLKERDLLTALKAIQSNVEISSFYFKNCELSGPVKNQLNLVLSNRPIKKLGFEGCGLGSFDMLWLKSIFKYCYGAKSITLVERLTSEEYEDLYHHFPLKHLKKIGLAPAQLADLVKVCSVTDPVDEIELIIKSPINCEQMVQLFELINSAMIRKLRIVPLLVDQEETYKYFMKQLKKNTVLQELAIGDYRGLENDLFMVLKGQNITLTSVTISGRVVRPSEMIDRVQSCLDRNKIMRDACEFTFQETPEDLDEEELEYWNARATSLAAALIEVQEKNYISASQDRIKELLEKLSASRRKGDLNRLII